MGLEKVKDRVIEEAKEKAATTINAAKEEARVINSSAAKQAKEREKAARDKLEVDIKSIKNRENAAAKLESKKLSLTFKKEFVDEILSEVKNKLEHFSDSTRAKHVKLLLVKAAKEISISTVYCNKKDRKTVDKYKVKDAPILGGVIAESANGTLRVDYSYETLLEQLHESLMGELNELLFK